MNGKGLLGITNKLMTKNLTNHNSILFLRLKGISKAQLQLHIHGVPKKPKTIEITYW